MRRKGPRLIVLGAAATDIGMISNVTEVYKVNKGKEAFDYHDNVILTIFHSISEVHINKSRVVFHLGKR